MPTIVIDEHFKKTKHTALNVAQSINPADNTNVYEPRNLMEVFAVENYCIAHAIPYKMYSTTATSKEQVPSIYGYRTDEPSSKVQYIVTPL